MSYLMFWRMGEALCTYIEDDRPFLGICLGLQLLFDSSEENGPGSCSIAPSSYYLLFNTISIMISYTQLYICVSQRSWCDTGNSWTLWFFSWYKSTPHWLECFASGEGFWNFGWCWKSSCVFCSFLQGHSGMYLNNLFFLLSCLYMYHCLSRPLMFIVFGFVIVAVEWKQGLDFVYLPLWRILYIFHKKGKCACSPIPSREERGYDVLL